MHTDTAKRRYIELYLSEEHHGGNIDHKRHRLGNELFAGNRKVSDGLKDAGLTRGSDYYSIGDAKQGDDE